MIETIQCPHCNWHYAPSLTRHDCAFTQWKRTILSAKYYLIRTHGEEEGDRVWGIFSEAHHNLIIAENNN